MNPETIEVYDWSEIKSELCKTMNIDERDFRNYQNVIGGLHKDLWHVCLEYIVPDSMNNDTIVKIYDVGEDCLDAEEFSGDNEWKLSVLKAWNKIYNEIDKKTGGKDSGIYVSFSW